MTTGVADSDLHIFVTASDEPDETYLGRDFLLKK